MNRAPAPEIIFYDMFSTKTSSRLWATRTFRKIFEVCADRAVELFTYTCSTSNRAAFLAAGFFVAKGRNAGDKTETTIALTPAALDSPGKPRRDLLSGIGSRNGSVPPRSFPPTSQLTSVQHLKKSSAATNNFEILRDRHVRHSPHELARTDGLLWRPGFGKTGNPPSHAMMWQAKTQLTKRRKKYG
jgi:Protein of unknown function (DUF752).